MTMMVAGLGLWVFAHFFKRLFPGLRQSMGKAGRGMVALAIAAGVGLMIFGYRATEYVDVYTLPPWVWHVNNALMLIAVYLFDAGRSKGLLPSRVRHPMLWGVVVWAAAHLLVNGDLAAVILFGGLGLWALAEMVLINRGEGPWEPPAPGPIARDLRVLAIATVIYAVIVAIHYWLGFAVIAILN